MRRSTCSRAAFLSGTINPNQLMAVNLHSSGNQQQFLDCRTDLSADYHTYSMEYRQGSSIKIFFDDSNVYTYYAQCAGLALTSSSCLTASHRRIRPAGTPRSATPRPRST